jgi:tetratricopeptide (TPR) repeat protein
VKAAAAIAALAFAAPSVVGADATQLGVGYICGAEQLSARPVGAAQAVMLAGVGNGASPADTTNAQAQAWYNEGLNLYHAFDHNEATAAFAKAAALDPNCALCEWGFALSLGPTLNYGVTPQQTALALVHAERARTLVKPGDLRAEGLISALQVRYGKDTPDARRDTLYGAAMDDMARRFPGDDEIAELAVHALLVPARRDDKSGVPRSEALLRDILARHPDDTAAIHYYIHATEFAGHPADALPYADRLAALAPGASHLVHMAAHTLMHVGQYERVAVVDAQALKVDADVEKELAYAGPLSSQMYYLHNYTFGLAGALMSGDRRLALKYADHAAVAFPAAFDRGAVALPSGVSRIESPANRRATADAKRLVAYGRYDPTRALAMTAEPGEPRVVEIYRHYARGEAYAAKGDAEGAHREADLLLMLEALALKTHQKGNEDIASIASDVLYGRAALMTHAPARAAELFARAAARQEKAYPFADNFDPPPWWYPVRRSLAAADLAAGRTEDAIREANTSLAAWPQDALALKVLSQAEARAGRQTDARRHMAQARRVWRGDLASVPLALV